MNVYHKALRHEQTRPRGSRSHRSPHNGSTSRFTRSRPRTSHAILGAAAAAAYIGKRRLSRPVTVIEPAADEYRWTVTPAKWSPGEWLVNVTVGGEVCALVPPGVALLEDPMGDPPVGWRIARWPEYEAFAVDEPPSEEVVIGTLREALAAVPNEHRDWLIERASAHATRLRRAARLLASSSDEEERARSGELLREAVTENADIEQVRSSVLRVREADPDRPRAEVVASLRVVAADVQEEPTAVFLRSAVDEMAERVEELVRDHAYLRASKSWALTSPLRFVRAQVQGINRSGHSSLGPLSG